MNQELNKEPPLEIISGAGGAGSGSKMGGGSSSPKDDSNTLASKSFASALFCIAEGPIQGFADPDPLKAIYLDNTPLRSATGVDYFKNVSLDYRLGYPNQAVMGQFAQVKKETPVGITVRNGTPQTRTLIDPQAAFVTIRIRIPSLFNADNSKGEVKRTDLRFQIQIGASGQPLATVLDKTYNDKCTSAFEESWQFNLPPSGSNSWDIRLVRITADSVNPKIANDLVWTSFTSIQPTSRSFENTAVLGLRLDSENFSSIQA